MGQHDPLGKTGGAGCVLHVDDIIGVHGILSGREFIIADLLTQCDDVIPIVHTGHFFLADINDVFQFGQFGALEFSGRAVFQLRADIVDHFDVLVGIPDAANQNQCRRIGLFHEIFQFKTAIAGVHRYHNGAHLTRAKLGIQPFRHIVGPYGDFVSLFGTDGHKPLGRRIADISELAVIVTDTELMVFKGQTVAELLGYQIQQLPHGCLTHFKFW